MKKFLLTSSHPLKQEIGLYNSYNSALKAKNIIEKDMASTLVILPLPTYQFTDKGRLRSLTIG